MILYTVKYKKAHWLFWKTLKNVQADGHIPNLPTRYFILKDDSRVEIPIDFMFKFSKERFECFKDLEAKMAEESKVPEGLTLVK